MSRKRRSVKRILEPDTMFKSRKVAKFINRLMLSGKKSLAENIVYKSLELLSTSTKQPAMQAFEKALNNVKPLMEVEPRRVGGSTYQVPIEVKPDRGITLAMRWIIANSRNRSGRSMIERLSAEFIDAYNGVGVSVKKREDTHKMAEANKAFAHFRW